MALLLVPLFLLDAAAAGGRGVTVVSGLAGFVYFVALDATGGTLGKRLLGLRVVGRGRLRPGLGPAAVRNLWLLTSLVPGAAGQLLAVLVSAAIAVTIARDPDRAGVHDRVAATLVRVPA